MTSPLSPSISSVDSKKRAFFVVASIMTIGMPVAMAMGMAGKPGAGANVDEGLPRVRRDAQAVEKMIAQIFGRSRSRQIEFSVCFHYQGTVAHQRCDQLRRHAASLEQRIELQQH